MYCNLHDFNNVSTSKVYFSNKIQDFENSGKQSCHSKEIKCLTKLFS